MKRLSPRQRIALDLLMEGKTQADVARETGYSQKQLSLLMNGKASPHFLAHWQRKTQTVAEKVGITAENVLSRVNDIADDPRANRAEKLKALEMLAKHLKLLTTEVERQPDNKITINWMGEAKPRKVIELDADYDSLPAPPGSEDPPQGQEKI